jgi:hypothetical protein
MSECFRSIVLPTKPVQGLPITDWYATPSSTKHELMNEEELLTRGGIALKRIGEREKIDECSYHRITLLKNFPHTFTFKRFIEEMRFCRTQRFGGRSKSENPVG